MNGVNQDFLAMPYRQKAGGDAALPELVHAVFSLLRRRWRLIAAAAFAGMALAAAYAYTATPLFQASAQVSVDPRRLSVLDTSEQRERQEPVFDPARVDSLVETARSDRVVRQVVADLKLEDDAEFNGSRPGGLMSQFMQLFASGEQPTADERHQATVEAVAGGFAASRVENTFVLELRFISESPQTSARIANGFATALMNDEINANSALSTDAAGWLKARIGDLAAQANAADKLVADYKRENGIAIADGKSIEEQALASLSTLLTDAVAAKATAQAKLDRIVAVNASEGSDLTVGDAMTNDVITKLRQDYLSIVQRSTDLASRVGEDHPLVQRLKTDAANVRQSMKDELRRIEQTYRSDLEIETARVAALRRGLDEQFKKTSDVGRAQVKLLSLESDARTTRAAYEAYGQRYLQAVAQQSFPVSEARLIAAATPPTKKQWPKRSILMALGLMAGGMIGLAAAVATDLADRTLRTRRDVSDVLGCDCFGYIPDAHREGARVVGARRLIGGRSHELAWDQVLKSPTSIEAETLRSMKVAADQAYDGEGARIIGLVSSLPYEGKTAIAANFANLIALNGLKVLLIDGDLRKSSLTRGLTPDAEIGLESVLFGDVDLASAVQSSVGLPLDFLPATARLHGKDSHEILGSPAMRALLAEARQSYDYVVIDLPPLLPIIDARAMASLLDGFILVIEWGETSRDVVLDALRSAPNVEDRLIGAVLNKVKLRTLTTYGESYGGGDTSFGARPRIDHLREPA